MKQWLFVFKPAGRHVVNINDRHIQFLVEAQTESTQLSSYENKNGVRGIFQVKGFLLILLSETLK